MRYYFHLQYKRIWRRLVDFGMIPWVAILLGSLLFVVGSILLLSKGGLASYLYGSIAILACTPLLQKQRIDFLRMTFPKKEVLQLRLLENSIIIAPFLFLLLIHQAWIC